MSTTEQDEDLAFEAGFNAVNADPADRPEPKQAKDESPDHAADPTADAKKSAVAEPEAKPEPVVDPFASLPPQVRDLLAAIPGMRAELETVRRVANMVPALQSRIDKMNQPAPATDKVPAKSRFAKIDAIRNDLPEIAEALDEIVNAQHQAHPEPQGQQRQPEAAPAEAANPQEEALSSVRPSWADDLTSSDFQLWLAQQPREYQAQVQSTSKAGDILTALGKFDAFRAQTQSTRQLTQTRTTRMAAAVAPQGDGRRQPARTAPEDDEEAAFAAAFKKARGR